LIDIACFITPEKIRMLKEKGRKILFRLDGVFTPAMTPNYKKENEVFRIKHNELADAVVYQSRYVRDVLCREFIGKTHPNSTIIHNGIDPTVFYPVDRGEVPKNILIFGIFRRRVYYHALLDGIMAFRVFQETHPDFTLTIKGFFYGEEGEEPEKYLVQILSNIQDDKRIIFDLSSRISNLRSPLLYRSSALFLHLRYGDPSPNVVVEAMACGTPVVGMTFGGDPEYIGNSGAIVDTSYKGHDLLPRVDAKEASDAMKFVIKHHKELKDRAVMRTHRLFSMDKIGAKYMRLLKALLEGEG
jgi:glycosyltransferase involved in cell wall biosynthesis